MNIAIATATFYKYVEDLRAGLALQFLKEAKEYEIPVAVVDGGSPDIFLDQMMQTGALVYKQAEPGMGESRRQAFSRAWDLLDCLPGVVIWMEPEKVDLVRFSRSIAEPILREKVDFVVPYRTQISAQSYPRFQWLQEESQGAVFEEVTGLHWGFFGPVAFGQTAIPYFLNSKEDKWDCLYFPQIQMLADGLKMGEVPVDFHYPAEQCDAEKNNEEYEAKRIMQTDEVIKGIRKAARMYGLKK